MLQKGAAIKGPMNLRILLDKSLGSVAELTSIFRKIRRHARVRNFRNNEAGKTSCAVAKKNASGCSGGNRIFRSHVSRNKFAFNFGSVIHSPVGERSAGTWVSLTFPCSNSRVNAHQRRFMQFKEDILETNLREYAWVDCLRASINVSRIVLKSWASRREYILKNVIRL